MEQNPNFISRYIPNSITLLSLCCGLSSVRYSIISEWKIAVFLILLASIFDFFDGWFARKLKGDTNFGAELDSLSDFVSFGIAPSLLIFFWSLSELKSIGWSVALFFSVCAALRLARFTADIYLAPKTINKKIYFVGVPSPAAALLSLLPIFVYFEFDFYFFKNPYLNLLNIIIISLLMISKIPTVSLKSINFNKKYTPLIILLIVICCVGIISNVWLSLVIISIIYICSIFYTIINNY